MSDFKFHFQGTAYDFEDFTLDELDYLEREFEEPWGEIDYTSAKAMRHVVTIVKRREDPGFDSSKLGSLSLKDFAASEKPKRPTRAKAASQ